MLGVLEPLEALAFERVRSIIHVVRDGPGYVLHVLSTDGWWMPQVALDIELIVEGSQVDVALPGKVQCKDWTFCLVVLEHKLTTSKKH